MADLHSIDGSDVRCDNVLRLWLRAALRRLAEFYTVMEDNKPGGVISHWASYCITNFATRIISLGNVGQRNVSQQMFSAPYLAIFGNDPIKPGVDAASRDVITELVEAMNLMLTTQEFDSALYDYIKQLTSKTNRVGKNIEDEPARHAFVDGLLMPLEGIADPNEVQERLLKFAASSAELL